MKHSLADRLGASQSIWIFAAIAFCLCIALIQPHFAQAATSGSAISLSAEAGFQGHYRGGQWMPIRVSMANNGPDINGQLRIVTRSNALGVPQVVFDLPVQLPTGSNKVLFIYAVFDPGTQQAQVDLLDATGLTLATTTAPLFPAANDDALYIVVNDAPAGTTDLTTLRPGTAVAYQANWPIDALPTQPEGWQGIDALLLTDTDTAKLNLDQTHSLTDWVLNGGHLIVTGGPDWQKTQAGLIDLLPAHVSGTITVDALDGLATFSGLASDAASLRGATVIAQGTPLPDAQVLAVEGNRPLVVRRATGLGIVDYLMFDPNLEPFRSWAERPALWTTLIPAALPRPGWSEGVVNAAAANDAANLASGLNFPDVIEVAGFLGLYILLIGPLNYLILRRLGRLEWAWFTIPALIALASLLAYSTGFSLRGSEPIVSRLSVVQVWPDAARARVDGVIGLASPRRTLYDLAVDQGVTVRTLDPNTTDVLGTNAQIVEYNGYVVEQIPVDAGLSASFISGGVIPAPALDGTATVQIDINGRTTVKGQIHNGGSFPLTDALVLFLNTPYPIGTLGAGESRPFTLIIEPSAPSVAAHGIPPNTGSGPANATSGPLTDLLNTGSASNTGQVNNLGLRAAARRQSFLSGVLDNADQGAGHGTGVYFLGWSSTAPFGATLDESGTTYNAEDTTLYAVKLRSSIVATGDQKTALLAPAFFQWTALSTNNGSAAPSLGSYVTTPYNVYLSSGQPAAFQFQPLAGVQLSSISALSVWAFTSADEQSFLLLWDWQTGQWSNFNAAHNNNVYTITDPGDLARFVGPGGTVRLQAVGRSATVRFDRLDVALTGTFGGNMPPETTF